MGEASEQALICAQEEPYDAVSPSVPAALQIIVRHDVIYARLTPHSGGEVKRGVIMLQPSQSRTTATTPGSATYPVQDWPIQDSSPDEGSYHLCHKASEHEVCFKSCSSGWELVV